MDSRSCEGENDVVGYGRRRWKIGKGRGMGGGKINAYGVGVKAQNWVSGGRV